jgi:DNA-binding MarR family transcriptional regulator
MESISSADPGAARHRRRLNRAVGEALRDLSIQLALLNHHVGGHIDLKGGDLECLDLISRYGPLSPSALARRAGLHPATMTGILDRLERGGWIARERDPADRRGVVVRLVRGRGAVVLRLYSGMNETMDRICAGYEEGELELLIGFMRRTAEAGRTAAEELAGS